MIRSNQGWDLARPGQQRERGARAGRKDNDGPGGQGEKSRQESGR